MIFHPQNCVMTAGSFVFSGVVKAVAHPSLNKDVIKEFWHNFTYGASTLSVEETNELVFTIGDANPLPLDGRAYSLNVTKGGVSISAENESNLVAGLMTLLDRITAVDLDDGTLGSAVECCEIKERPLIKNRMVHFCIFPETGLLNLKRFVRLCGALKYTHIVLEFWGMLKYDCMKELSWSHGFTKDEIRPIIKEANDLGMEVIPMFNHWGHASSSRLVNAKHVVLDQNPARITYFTPDGWCWDLKKEKVRNLLRSIRKELIELCGDGSYFHIGCDEAYNFSFSEEDMRMICGFLNEVNEELSQVNRRLIIWGDMFLYRYPHYINKDNCNARSPETEQFMVGLLDKRILIADWHYTATEAPVESYEVFKKAGFDSVMCPWDRGVTQMLAITETIKQNDLFGLLHTTWHTLTTGMYAVSLAAIECFGSFGTRSRTGLRTHTAELWRKVLPVEGDYEMAGWKIHQIEF